MRSSFLKRSLDVALGTGTLVVLSPVLLLVAVGVWLDSGSPLLFWQERPGLHGVPFRMCKFRTMRDAFDTHGEALPDAARVTRFGRLLRATSLDELPELWNVLIGDMSLVGPRPLLLEYLPLYSPTHFRRHEVRPGITGLAQVKGRNALTWEDKFACDVWYVDHWTNGLDLKILTMTVCKVMRAEGISQQGHATAEKFRGSIK